MGLKETLQENCHNSIYLFDLFKKIRINYKILIIILFLLGAVFTVLFAAGTLYFSNIFTISNFIFAALLHLFWILLFFKLIKKYTIKNYPLLIKRNECFTVKTLEKIQKFKLRKNISHLIPINKDILWNLITSFKDDLKMKSEKKEKSMSEKFVLPLVLFVVSYLVNLFLNNLEMGDTIWVLVAVLYIAALVYAILFIVDLLYITPRKDRVRNEKLRLISVLEEKYFEENK